MDSWVFFTLALPDFDEVEEFIGRHGNIHYGRKRPKLPWRKPHIRLWRKLEQIPKSTKAIVDRSMALGPILPLWHKPNVLEFMVWSKPHIQELAAKPRRGRSIYIRKWRKPRIKPYLGRRDILLARLGE